MNPVIEKAIERIPNGNLRLTTSAYPLGSACLTCLDEVPVGMPDTPNFPILEYSSDFDDPGEAEIRRDVLEEVKVIQNILKGLDTEDFNISNDRLELAAQLWRFYANPFRLRDGFVHVARIDGSLVVHRGNAQGFMMIMATKLANHMRKFDDLQKKHDRWKRFGICILSAVFIVLYMLLQNFLAWP